MILCKKTAAVYHASKDQLQFDNNHTVKQRFQMFVVKSQLWSVLMKSVQCNS